MLTEETDSPTTHYATIGEGAKLINLLVVSSADSGSACSYAGGCQYKINSPGLSTLLKDSINNHVSVCD
jgi:hypothetical protein